MYLIKRLYIYTFMYTYIYIYIYIYIYRKENYALFNKQTKYLDLNVKFDIQNFSVI